MTVEEIFRDLSAHMVKGVMLHDQMADYYDFLNLHGYKRCHEYHAKCEMSNYRKFHRFFINHYNKLVVEKSVENPGIIPATWYKYTRQNVDANTKRTAVKNGIEKWVAWEQETKELYENMYKELIELGEITAANKLKYMLYNVSQELKTAQRKHINLVSVDYAIEYILSEQDKIHDNYKKMLKHAEGL